MPAMDEVAAVEWTPMTPQPADTDVIEPNHMAVVSSGGWAPETPQPEDHGHVQGHVWDQPPAQIYPVHDGAADYGHVHGVWEQPPAQIYQVLDGAADYGHVHSVWEQPPAHHLNNHNPAPSQNPPEQPNGGERPRLGKGGERSTHAGCVARLRHLRATHSTVGAVA
ncbi:hypothetical protein Bbelb_036200 [Branchiostoma belcheri]|nr:hypothetical protein Bbelb_036200 [Branchiostoma belcheri]